MDSLAASASERTFIMIKPDGLQRGLVGTIIEKFEKKGLKLIAMQMQWATQSQIEETYKDEINAPYFPLLIKIMTAAPVVPMVWQGLNAIRYGGILISENGTQEDALPGTIRGDFSLHVGRNVCHRAETLQEAEMDIQIWFPDLPSDVR